MISELETLSGTMAVARTGRAVGRPLAAFAVAWKHAKVRAILDSATIAWRALTVSQRVRAVGCCLLSAAIADGLLSLFDPSPSSAARWTLWGAVVLIAAVAACFPQQATIAWSDWRNRR